MSILNTSILDKLDYDSKFEIIKQLVIEKPSLIKKLKFLYEFNDPRLISYFKDKFIIPVNISSFDTVFSNFFVSPDMSLFQFISKHNFTLKNDFSIKKITDCYKKTDIPHLEWWLNTGIFDYSRDELYFNREIDLVRMVSKSRFSYFEDLSLFNNLILSDINVPDLEVLEWFSRNKFDILGAYNVFVYHFLYNNLNGHSMWMLYYIKKSKNTITSASLAVFKLSVTTLAFLYIRMAFVNNHKLFNFLLINDFPFDREIDNIIKKKLRSLNYSTQFFDKYNNFLNDSFFNYFRLI
jgi:hypothetical protein